MDEKLKSMLQEILDMNHAEKVNLGRECVDQILSGMKEVGITGDDYSNFIIWIIKLFVSADKACSQEEYDLICDIYDMNISSQDFFDMTNGGADPDFINGLDEMIDSLDSKTKSAICMFGTLIMASDGTLTVAEQQLLLKILD